jgi:hypothetical protein
MRRLLRRRRRRLSDVSRRLRRLLNRLFGFFVNINGITVTTVHGPNQTPCGGFKWRVTFELDRPSPAGGWIVQQVDEERQASRPTTSGTKVTSISMTASRRVIIRAPKVRLTSGAP